MLYKVSTFSYHFKFIYYSFYLMFVFSIYSLKYVSLNLSFDLSLISKV